VNGFTRIFYGFITRIAQRRANLWTARAIRWNFKSKQKF
jgi:hypothetical protein